MVYKVLLEKTEEGYSVSVPGLPGCWTQGETEAEAMENAVEDQERLFARSFHQHRCRTGINSAQAEPRRPVAGFG